MPATVPMAPLSQTPSQPGHRSGSRTSRCRLRRASPATHPPWGRGDGGAWTDTSPR